MAPQSYEVFEWFLKEIINYSSFICTKRFIFKNEKHIHMKKLKFISPTERIDMHVAIRCKS